MNETIINKIAFALLMQGIDENECKETARGIVQEIEKQYSIVSKKKIAELLADIDTLCGYIANVTGRDFEECAVYEVCKKYE